jgi:hypothetical protein
MNRLFVCLALCGVAAISAPVLAHGDDEEEHVVHYEVAAPESDDAALKMLQEKTDEIGALVANAVMDDNQLESIHEKTYSLEAAVTRLRSSEHNDARQSALDTADEAVQALHYASENHEQEAVREWFKNLQPAVDGVETAYVPQAATPSAIQN